VTFALFAYNQEKYIREAVEAALAQDYAPLQIIISDDCSSDRTFEVIKALVSAYQGPHEVTCRQTAANRGSLLHVAEVAELARGGLVVMAAGDDVSKSSRVRTLAAAWLETGAWGICSRYDLMDESGEVTDRAVVAPVLQTDTFKRYLDVAEGPVPIVHGCSSAYDRRVFDHLQLDGGDYILAEDGALTVLINLLGEKVVHIDDSLISYRVSEGSLTNSKRKRNPSLAELAIDEQRIQRLAIAQANRCRLFLRMNEYLGARQIRRMIVENVEKDRDVQDAKAAWWSMTLRQRVAYVAAHPRSQWALGRMVGLKPFLLSKWVHRRLSSLKGADVP
jgi:cellulose synthase/poly-beta-1,6-N-acetylglucosamine synthase-like glycosyltransferase